MSRVELERDAFAARALVLLAPLLSLACGPGDEQPPAPVPASATQDTPGPGPTGEDREQLLENLGGLGYAEWDRDADVTLSGVVRYDRERAAPGYNLYASGDHEVYLVDMEGRRVHTWRLSEKRQRTTFAELLADDTLAVICNYQLMTRLDRDSRVLWELDLRTHHDVAQGPDGVIVVPYVARETYNGRQVRFDGLARVSLAGKVLSTWNSFDHLEELRPLFPTTQLDVPPAPGEPPPKRLPDYLHLNTVELLPDTELGRRDRRFRAGNVLVGLRNMSLIAVLDQDDHSVLWTWGKGELEGVHMPTMLGDGHILVYDNGILRKATRILEIDPASGAIVWKYEGKPPQDFYSELRGSNQRLEGGNTLICEADRGHVIEVTPAGEIVWEFWNPEILDGARKRIYRLMRLPVARVEALLARKPADPGSR